MNLSRFLSSWKKRWHRSLPKKPAAKSRFCPALEVLEDRIAPANTITIAVGGSLTIPSGATTYADTGTYTIDPSALNSATAPIDLRANLDINFNNAVSIANAAANLDAEALQSISVNANADIAATGGNSIALIANQEATPATGSFDGVNVEATVETQASGNITIVGHGGNNSGNSRNRGVFVYGGSIQSLGTGSITITGTGGDGGTDDNIGVSFENNGNVSSAAGSITITGTGGNGSTYNNIGVAVLSGATITAAGGAPITITGTGGDGTNQNAGLVMTSGNISTQNGAMQITGTAVNGTGSSNNGIWLLGGTIDTTGGNLTITGSANVASGNSINISGAAVSTTSTGSLTLNAAQDVAISGGASLSTADGNLTVLANQGTIPAAGNFIGIAVNGATIQTTGAGRIVLQGRGGNDTSSGKHIGIQLYGAAKTQTTGGGSVTLIGTGGAGSFYNYGVEIGDGGSAGKVTTASDGALTITGTGGGSTGALISAGQNYGVFINSGSLVQSTGSGAITLNGQGGIGVFFVGANPVGANLGVDITDSGTSITSATGPIAVTGSAGTAAGDVAVNVVSSAQLTASNAPIALTGDSMTLDNTILISAASNIVTLQPFTIGTQIDLGGSNSAGVLGLDAAALNTISSGALHIGNGTAGAITVSAAAALSGAPTLTLLTGAGIGETGAGALTVANLRTSSFGAVDLAGANVVGSLAAQEIGAGPFTFDDNNPLVVSTVEGVPGITTGGGNVALTVTGALGIGTGVGEGITAPGAIVDLDAAGATENGGSTVSAAGLRLRGTGTFTLDQANAVSTLAGSTVGPVNYVGAGPMVIGSLLGTNGLDTGNGDATLDITAGNLGLTAPLQAGTGTIDLTVAGAITGGGNANPVVAAALAVHSATGIGTAIIPLYTGLGTLAANVGSNGIFLINTGNLTIGSVNGVNGVTSAGGPIDIQSNGDFTDAQPVTTGTLSGDDVTLTGNGTINLLAPLAGSTAAVLGGPGDDTVNLESAMPQPLTINGLGGSNTFNFDVSQRALFTLPGKYTIQGQPPIYYRNFAAIFLNNAGSVSTFYGPDTADRPTALAGLTPPERFVQVLYLDALGRAGSKAELDGWVSILTAPGGSQAVVANAIERSQEARDHLVRTWYQTYLGRTAQNGEEMYWVSLLLQGQTEEAVLSDILGSTEFFNRAPTITGDGGPATNQEFVKALYEVLLNRTGSNSEWAAWVNAIPTLGRNGVALAIEDSSECRSDVIDAVYNALLHRPSDPSGLNFWLAADLDTTQLRVGIESSTEFYRNG